MDDFGEHIEHVEDIGIIEQRQVYEVLDLTVADQRPDPVVLLHDVIARRMRRPIRAVAAKVIEKHFDGAVAAIQGRIKGDLQSRHNRKIVAAPGALRQHGQAAFGCDHVCSKQFALGYERLNREDKVIVTLPILLA